MGNGTGKPGNASGSKSPSSSSKKKKKTGRLGPAGGGARSTLGKNPNGTPARATGSSRTLGASSPPTSPERGGKERSDVTSAASDATPSATSRTSNTPRASSTARSAVVSPRTAQPTPREAPSAAGSVATSPAASVQSTPRATRAPAPSAASQQHINQASPEYQLAPLQENEYEYDERYMEEPAVHPAFANPAFTAEDHLPLVAPTGAYLQEEPGYPADRGQMTWPPAPEQLDPLASWPPAMTYAACIPATPYRVSAGGMPQSPLPSAAGVEPSTYDPFNGLPSGSGLFGNPNFPLTHFRAAANAQVYVNPTSVVWGKQVIPPPEYTRELEQQNIILWSTQKQLAKILQDEESQKWLRLLQVSLMTVLKLNPVQQLTVRSRDAAFTEEDVWRETQHFQAGGTAVTAKEYVHNIERQNRLLWETQALVSSIFTNPDTERWTKRGQAAMSTVLNLNRIEKLVMKARTPEQVREDERKEMENANPYAKPTHNGWGVPMGAAAAATAAANAQAVRQARNAPDGSGGGAEASTGARSRAASHAVGPSSADMYGGGGNGRGSFDSDEKSYDSHAQADFNADARRSITPQQMSNQPPASSVMAAAAGRPGGAEGSMTASGLQLRQRAQSIDQHAPQQQQSQAAPPSSAAARRQARAQSASGHRSFLDAHALVAESNSQQTDEADELDALQMGEKEDEEQLESIVRDAVMQATPRGRADPPEPEALPERPPQEDGGETPEPEEERQSRPAAFKPLTGNPNNSGPVRVHDDDASTRRGSGTMGGGGASKSGGVDPDQLFVYMDEDADAAPSAADSYARGRPAANRSGVAPSAMSGDIEALPGARQRRVVGGSATRGSLKGSSGDDDDAREDEHQTNLQSPTRKPLISPGPRRKPQAAGMSAATQALILKQLAMKASRQK